METIIYKGNQIRKWSDGTLNAHPRKPTKHTSTKAMTQKIKFRLSHEKEKEIRRLGVLQQHGREAGHRLHEVRRVAAALRLENAGRLFRDGYCRL